MLSLFNTLSGKKEVLRPLVKGKVKLFVCGLTVYDYAHIGNARTYIVFDAFARYLRSIGLNVFYLQNVTDIDDKIIKRAQEQGILPKELAKKFEKIYREDCKTLGISGITKYARATGNIAEIISQTRRLLKKGYAYAVEGDGVYYDISKFKGYGKLAHRTARQAEDGVSRIDESVHKRNKGDFALWKISKQGEPQWSFTAVQEGSAVRMDGRPGWHIEDTAITEKYFGSQYDIHGGARDLIFPHHEAEIAQMEAISGKSPLARYWMHGGFLTVNGEKMSKSLGNFITIRDFLAKHSPRILRMLALKAHYRSPIDYSDTMIFQTQKELERVDEFVDKLKQKSRLKTDTRYKIQDTKYNFLKALEDDFNTPKAFAVIFELISRVNPQLSKGLVGEKDKQNILAFLKDADKILKCIFWGREKTEKVPADIVELAEQREVFRKHKEWEKADEARKDIETRGWTVQDTSGGYFLKKAQ
ncbi:MAG: cysteine--tRNA ligase [Candidatus Wildermuthbacteria bacterium]|nr:cysteine--tRNA ligase [Candidatus Wildermuthbacteria bacterium]